MNRLHIVVRVESLLMRPLMGAWAACTPSLAGRHFFF